MENKLSPGDIVSGFDPAELVEIRKLSPFGNKTLIEAVGLESRREIRRPLTPEQLARLVKIRSGGYSFDGNAETFLLGTEAERIRIAYQFDPLFAVNSSVIDVLPHQVDAVYRYLLPLPRIRFGSGDSNMRRIALTSWRDFFETRRRQKDLNLGQGKESPLSVFSSSLSDL